jgi:hypothetical protein
MPFDFSQFFVLAEELSARADEASKRSSISRAYYAAYHLAFSRAEANVGLWHNRANRKLGAHAWCWLQYTSTNDPACQQLGVDGGRMKRRRHTADYDHNDIPNLDAEVERQIEEVRQFQGEFAALDPQCPRP